ncbi:polysaccharide biosynthesis/export family protein [Sphingomonas sp. PB2P19]|uniref:polysaccharide biosynthesis/export family protein n=1 Tax=Sphingomonas rhamnosi TaxID=3096156 RepID=UPI002FC99D6A
MALHRIVLTFTKVTAMIATMVVAIAVPGAGALAQTAMPTPPAALALPLAATTPAYELGTGDEVQITLFGQQDMTVRTRVREDGTIAYPLLGNVGVAGRRAADVATIIASRLKAGGYYAKPIVNVDVTSYVSKSFTLFGSFGTPGIYPIDRPTTLAMAIARGGGVKSDAADFALLRRIGEANERRIDFADLSDTGGINTLLQPGDTVVVNNAPQVFVYGQVGSPGSYPIKGRMTLRQALIRAGGLTLAGNEKSVTLRRDGQILKRINLDEEVRADDVLFVNERFF